MSEPLSGGEPAASSDRTLAAFLAILGVLSVLSYPVFYLIWGMERIGTGRYVALVLIFTIAFFVLAMANWRFEKVRCALVVYLNYLLPAFYICVLLALGGLISADAYLATLVALHAVYLAGIVTRDKFSSGARGCAEPIRFSVYLVVWGNAFAVVTWFCRTCELFQPAYFSSWITVTGLSVVFVAVVLLLERWQRDTQMLSPSVAFWVAALLIAVLVYQPGLFVDRWHFGYFLAPVNDVLHGKFLFVNSASQYGMGVIYALAVAFRAFHLPVGYEALSCIIAILFIAQYVLLSYFIWRGTGDASVTVLGTCGLIYFNYLSVFWPSMLRTPAQSPLRYGLIYMLLCIGMCNRIRARPHLRVLELGCVLLVSIWSFETFVSAMLSLHAFYLVSDVFYGTQMAAGMKVFAKRIFMHSGVALSGWTLWSVGTYAFSGQFPDLSVYFDYFSAYGAHVSIEKSPLVPHMFRTGGVLYVYVASICVVLSGGVKRRVALSAPLAGAIVGMSVAGLLQFPYYFIFYVDHHLALLCVPLIVVVTLWAAVIRRSMRNDVVLGANALGALATVIVVSMVVPAPKFHEKFARSFLYEVAVHRDVTWANPYSSSPSNSLVATLVDLIDRYAGRDQEVVIFAPRDDQVEALLLSGKTDLLDMSNPEMSAQSAGYAEYVTRRATEVKGTAEFIFYAKTREGLLPIQARALQVLLEGLRYEQVAAAGDVVVLRTSKQGA